MPECVKRQAARSQDGKGASIPRSPRMPRSPRLDFAGVAQNVIRVEMIGKPASSGRPVATVCVTRVSDMSCDGSSFQISLCIKGAN